MNEMSFFEILNIFCDFSLLKDKPTNGPALWDLTLAEYDKEWNDE